MKRIAIIGTAGVPGKYGGFETLAHHLVLRLANDYTLSVYNSKTYYPKDDRVKYWNKARIHYVPFNANGIQSIIYDMVSIIHAIFKNDVLLVLGVSGSLILPLVKLLTRKKIIVNIDGQEWKRPKWGKMTRRFLKFSEFLAVKFSHADVTDNVALQRYTASQYNTLSTLIEYGSDHVKQKAIQDVSFVGFDKVKSYLKKHVGSYAMKVCRIEPENNIHIVLEAFSQIPDKKLLIVGNWNNSDYGKDLRAKYASFGNITMSDPIYNQDILDQLRKNCVVYIHGHSAGGTNPSLVEAMGLGKPIIAYKVVFNEETTEHEALYFSNVKGLIKTLSETSVLEYNTVGQSMQSIAHRRYQWDIIAQKYSKLIQSVFHLEKKQHVDAKLSRMKYPFLEKYGLLHFKNSIYYSKK